jgi:geranylgeranyl reductase family protein
MPVADVIVIGAGPAGAASAIELARRGHAVLLLERDSFPRDKTCGSGLSPTAIALAERLGVGRELRARAEPISRVKIVTPGGRSMVLASDAAAVVLLRREFDALLVERALALGAELRDRTQAKALLQRAGRVIGVRLADGSEVRAPYVVCADGAQSIFSNDPRPKRSIVTLMGWWENAEFLPGQLELIFDRELAPLYGWLFPETRARVNIGICMDGQESDGGKARRNVRRAFEAFVAAHFAERLRGATQLGALKGHPIVHATHVDHCTLPGALFAGESGRISNYATGEGISQAMQSGIFAAEALHAVLCSQLSEAEAFRRYLWRQRRRFGLERVIASGIRAFTRSELFEQLARFHARPWVERSLVGLFGSALAGSSVRATSTS